MKFEGAQALALLTWNDASFNPFNPISQNGRTGLNNSANCRRV